jgi:enoyl-CoA hydratase/carnithine racemase
VPSDLLERAGLTFEVRPPRATITLNRPESLNAQTPHTWAALAAIGDSLRDPVNDQVRVVVVRGAGRAFSAGLDRRMFDPAGLDGVPGPAEMAAMPESAAETHIAGYQAGFGWLRDPRWVTVAAVQGHAIGAGFQLALACDLRLVADDARFCMAEVTLGLVPDLGGTYPLVHAVGYARAVEICLSARRVAAAEAVSIGLALRSVPAAELDTAVDELVGSLTAAPAGATAETLALLSAVADGAGPADALAAERAAQVRRLRSLVAGKG